MLGKACRDACDGGVHSEGARVALTDLFDHASSLLVIYNLYYVYQSFLWTLIIAHDSFLCLSEASNASHMLPMDSQCFFIRKSNKKEKQRTYAMQVWRMTDTRMSAVYRVCYNKLLSATLIA